MITYFSNTINLFKQSIFIPSLLQCGYQPQKEAVNIHADSLSKYYTDLISFYKIFFSDLASHLVPFSSLNNILIILLNVTVDRKSELIRRPRSARS